MPRNGTGLGNAVLLMRRPLWEKVWAKQLSFHSHTKPRETPLSQQILVHTSPGICSPQLASGTACGWDQDFPWQGRVHGWGSCKPPSPSGPWASDVLQPFFSFNLDNFSCQSVQLSKPDQMLIKCKSVQMSIYISWGCAPLFIMNHVSIVQSWTQKWRLKGLLDHLFWPSKYHKPLIFAQLPLDWTQ